MCDFRLRVTIFLNKTAFPVSCAVFYQLVAMEKLVAAEKALSLSVSKYFWTCQLPPCSFYRWREHSHPGWGTDPSSERPGAASRLPAGEEPPSSTPTQQLRLRAFLCPRCGAQPVLGSVRRVTTRGPARIPRQDPPACRHTIPKGPAPFLLQNLKDRVCFSITLRLPLESS